MSGRNLLLTGVPRSGTTLCCRLLGQASDTVALFEPMHVLDLPTEQTAARQEVEKFLAGSRASLASDRTAWSQQVAGAVPDNPFSSHRDSAGRRRHEAVRGRSVVDKPLSENFTLVMKHNAAFTALLPELVRHHEVRAIVRNPLAVLASWYSVDLPVSRGRLPAGEHLDPALAQRLDGEPDRLARQLLILDWFFERYQRCLPPECVLSYEEIIAGAGRPLAEAFLLDLPSLPLQERNASHLYDVETCERLTERLLADNGAWRSRYGDAEVVGLLQRLRDGLV